MAVAGLANVAGPYSSRFNSLNRTDSPYLQAGAASGTLSSIGRGNRAKRLSTKFRYPSVGLRDRVRAAVKERGFHSEQAFLIAACENELERGDCTEATYQLEARIAATLANMAKEVNKATLEQVLNSGKQPSGETVFHKAS